MTFRTRLTIAFLVIVLIPITLFGAAILAMTKYESYMVSKNFGVETDFYGIAMNSVQIFASLTDNIYEELKESVETDSAELEDIEFLKETNARLEKISSFLIVRKGRDIYYTGDVSKSTGIEDLLPKYEGIGNGINSRETYIREKKMIIKQVDFRFNDHSKGTAFIVTLVSDLIPDMKTSIIKTVLLLVLILIITGIALVSWIYTGIVSPLREISSASQKIQEGMLDFEINIPPADDEVSRLCRNFEEMRKRLKESAEIKIESENENRTLITNISHDLKTPVTSIKGYAEGLLDGVADTPEKKEKYLRTIFNKANEVDRLINELTFYAGIDTDRIPYNFAKVNATDYFNDCAEELKVELESRSYTFVYTNAISSDLVIIADPIQLKKVINNIVGNSIKYMDKAKAKIALSLKESDSELLVSIMDNGAGIEEKNLPYIFDRFYREDSSRNSAKGGSGIGLSIVKKIVDDHGGRVWAASRKGEGTTINIALRKVQWGELNE